MSNIKSFNSFNEAKKDRPSNSFKSGFEVPPPIPPPHLYPDRTSAKNKKIKKDVKKAKTLKGLKEHKETQNYMFFGNLQTMKRLIDKMLEMDESEIDEILKEHNWALDHIATSKDDVEEVFNFLAGHNSPEGMEDDGPEMEEDDSEEVGCGCCDECNGQEDCECCDECTCNQSVINKDDGYPVNLPANFFKKFGQM